MRAVICVLVMVGLLLPDVAVCASAGAIGAGADRLGSRRAEVACIDSASAGGGGDGRVVGTGADDGFWFQVIRWIIRVVRDGVAYDIVKWVVKRSWERPPAPVQSPNWSETGCGMGAAGGSRY